MIGQIGATRGDDISSLLRFYYVSAGENFGIPCPVFIQIRDLQERKRKSVYPIEPNKHDNFDTKGIETIVLFSFYGIYCGIRLFGAYAFLFSFIVLLATRFSVRFRANLCSEYNHADTFIVE